MPKWVSAKKARLIVGVHTTTLRRWDHEGKIKTKRTPGNHRLYDIEPFFGPSEAPVHQPNKEGIIYARVSSKTQIADLERQIQHLRAEYPGYKVVRDVGSGINWITKPKRPDASNKCAFSSSISLARSQYFPVASYPVNLSSFVVH